MTTFYATEAGQPHPAVSQGGSTTPRRRHIWLDVILVCVLLTSSGLVRTWQDHRFDAAKHRVVTPLFPLKELPTKLGKWKLKDGAQTKLDPQVAQIAGAVDSLIRSYVDESTGVVVTVLVLYGRAEEAVPHIPEACYPSTGYTLVDDVFEVGLDTGSVPSSFRSLVYQKEGGAVTGRQEVYYAFRHEGRWTPEVAGNWRTLRYSPAVFKVQTQRAISDHERRNVDNPSEQFLTVFIKALEERIAAASPQPTKS